MDMISTFFDNRAAFCKTLVDALIGKQEKLGLLPSRIEDVCMLKEQDLPGFAELGANPTRLSSALYSLLSTALRLCVDAVLPFQFTPRTRAFAVAQMAASGPVRGKPLDGVDAATVPQDEELRVFVLVRAIEELGEGLDE